MFQVKFNEQSSVIANTAFGIGLGVVIMLIQNQPSFAGAQSLLDPYADVNPVSPKPESKIKKAFKQTVKQRENNAQRASAKNIDSTETNNAAPALASAVPNKVKDLKTVKPKVSRASNPGFLSGIKEMQHGSITSIKAAGGGIVSGSKAAGSKVADGTRSIGSGIAAASSKVISGPKNLVAKTKASKSQKAQLELADASSKVKPPHKGLISKLPGLKFSKSKKSAAARVAANPKVNSGHKGLISKLPALKFPKFKKTPPQVVANTGISSGVANPVPTPSISSLPGKPIFPSLPGKPLDQVLVQEKQRRHMKDVTFSGEEKRKPGIITSAVGKIGFLHKDKKAPTDNAVASNLTANNANRMPQ